MTRAELEQTNAELVARLDLAHAELRNALAANDQLRNEKTQLAADAEKFKQEKASLGQQALAYNHLREAAVTAMMEQAAALGVLARTPPKAKG